MAAPVSDLAGRPDQGARAVVRLEPIDGRGLPGIEQIVMNDGVAVLMGRGQALGVLRSDAQSKLEVRPCPCPAGAPMGADQIPQSRLVEGRAEVAQAWFAGPTELYGHGVLGDAIEASSLRVRTREGRVLEVEAGPGAVFEDLVPRLVEIEGRTMVWVVRALVDAGAAPVIFEVEEGELRPFFEPEPLGTPFRWLNPIAVADLDGEPGLELAYVERPHLDGTVQVWTLREGRFVRLTRLAGYSNHGIGSTALGLSGTLELDGQPGLEVIVPTRGRRALAVLALRGDELIELERVALPEEVASDMVMVAEGVLAFATADGALWSVSRAAD